MIDRIVQEWRTRGIGVLIVGGQVMLASGLRRGRLIGRVSSRRRGWRPFHSFQSGTITGGSQG
jgi:hypothetical protein